MPKHIAGNPNMIVQNVPGAGGLAATNYLYGIAHLSTAQEHSWVQVVPAVQSLR